MKKEIDMTGFLEAIKDLTVNGMVATLLFGFYAELDGSDEIRLEDGELSVGQWMTREEIEEDANQESLTWEMIERFKHGEERS